jgi:hypothetical protein
MQQTESRDAVRGCVITEQQDAAITEHQGHTATTARLHYKKNAAEDVALRAIEAHDAIHGMLPSSLPDLYSSDDDCFVSSKVCDSLTHSLTHSLSQDRSQDDYGDDEEDDNEATPAARGTTRSHDSPDEDVRPVKRVRTTWSHEEESWLEDWVAKYVKTDRYRCNRIDWKECAGNISSCSAASSVFLPVHVKPSALHETCKRIAKRKSIPVHALGQTHN